MLFTNGEICGVVFNFFMTRGPKADVIGPAILDVDGFDVLGTGDESVDRVDVEAVGDVGIDVE